MPLIEAIKKVATYLKHIRGTLNVTISSSSHPFVPDSFSKIIQELGPPIIPRPLNSSHFVTTLLHKINRRL